MMIENNSSAVFERCSFAGIVNRQANGSAITARNVDRSSRTSSTVLVRESTLANVTSPFFSFNKPSGGRFYSDMPLDVFQSIPGEHSIFAAEPVQDAQPVGGAMFLREADRPSVLDISEPTPPVCPLYANMPLLHTYMASQRTCGADAPSLPATRRSAPFLAQPQVFSRISPCRQIGSPRHCKVHQLPLP